jgi:hypothetical protein
MHEPNKLAFKISNDQQQENSKRPKANRVVTHERVAEWIRRQGLDQLTTEDLIELSSRYPVGALASFKKNFHLMIQRVRATQRKEKTGVPNNDKKSQCEEPRKNIQVSSLDDLASFDFGQAQQETPDQSKASDEGEKADW